MPNIFKDGGGAGIGSYVVVFKDGELAENTDLLKLRGAYEAGEAIYFSIIDDETEDALVQATGWIDEESKLHLVARDMDDGKQYELAMTDAPIASEIEVEYEVKDQIEIDGEPIGEGGGGESYMEIDVRDGLTFEGLAEEIGLEGSEKKSLLVDFLYTHLGNPTYRIKGTLTMQWQGSPYMTSFESPDKDNPVNVEVIAVSAVADTLVNDFLERQLSGETVTSYRMIPINLMTFTNNEVVAIKNNTVAVAPLDDLKRIYNINFDSSQTISWLLSELGFNTDTYDGQPILRDVKLVPESGASLSKNYKGILSLNYIRGPELYEIIFQGEPEVHSGEAVASVLYASHQYPTSTADAETVSGFFEDFASEYYLLPVIPQDAASCVYSLQLDHGTLTWHLESQDNM